VCGNIDNCPAVANPTQTNADGDALGDACDACPNDAANDTDGDEVCGNVDNCPTIANASQANADGDAPGDACDACPLDDMNDSDKDGFCGNLDNCRLLPNPDQDDFDGDGLGDACERGVQLADADLSGRVDGLDLAVFGRAFGASAGQPNYDADVDFDRNGEIDGSDLAMLAADFAGSYSTQVTLALPPLTISPGGRALRRGAVSGSPRPGRTQGRAGAPPETPRPLPRRGD
jgi:hypothetical protein